MSVNEREEREPLEEALEDESEPSEEDELIESVEADLKVEAFCNVGKFIVYKNC